ncbi:late blight resistance homolog R1A-10 [Olea europaea subsp. europaea]|uniref:Late blight resistance homolog R1A-10 n=1 Tax=Olea europaea subsp. europaea TaxID=158383 RepID=A0A8S0R6L1_OLEEU|nr:late blight resistance homolog R1A-10 [Olea europaea subsp. europaea]
MKKRVEKIGDESDVQDLQSGISSLAVSSNPASSGIGKSNTVGLDDDMLKIKERLTGGSLNLETVSLVGMGGIGKSTLATKIYEDEYIVYHFHIRAWVTVSQEYNVGEILKNVLRSMKLLTKEMLEASIDQLSESMYKNLKGRRYVIVLDDVWDTKVLDDLKRLFPNDKNGSRIMLTTRLEQVANHGNSSRPYHMRFLNWDESWNLFCGKVFGKDFCPPELEKDGKKIVQSCQGLPLAIVVIGGLLAKAIQTPDYWENVEKNLSSIMISNDEHFSKILTLSYKHLPRHLKGCFLCMAIFPEYHNISISKLYKLWFAEGLLKSVKSKSLEDVAEGYLFDLVDRNLVLVHQQSSKGKMKTCKIHDLLRDLCMREAEREKFFHVLKKDLLGISKGIGLQRLIIHSRGENHYTANCLPNLLVRSLFNFGKWENFSELDLNVRLLKVLETGSRIMTISSSVIVEMINLRYLACTCKDVTFLSSLHKLRNLHTIIVRNVISTYVGLNIWKMPQLRHVQLNHVVLPDPSTTEAEEENCFIVLEHLQTLSMVYDFKLTLEILKRIPNLKKLGIHYEQRRWNWGDYCQSNLVSLHNLESLKCTFSGTLRSSLKNVTFPKSLQKLTVTGGKFPWKDMKIIGSLPNLQVLKLKNNAFHGRDWEPNEGEFLQLKFLLLEDICLVHWRADNIHFPRLQHLVILSCEFLNEIPSSIGEVPTLLSIKGISCSDSVITSANQIQEEQHSLGNDGFQVQFQFNSNDVYLMRDSLEDHFLDILGGHPQLSYNNKDSLHTMLYGSVGSLQKEN